MVDDGDGDGKYDDPSGDMILHTRTNTHSHYLLLLTLILRIVYAVYGTINIRSQSVCVFVPRTRVRVNGEK